VHDSNRIFMGDDKTERSNMNQMKY
jgi:hypothetical protein